MRKKKMQKRVSAIIFTLLIMMLMAFVLNIQTVNASGNPLTNSYTLNGHLDVKIAAVAIGGIDNPSGTFVISGIPSGSTIMKALMYQEDGLWEGQSASANLAGNDLGSIAPLTHFHEDQLTLATFRWDVTSFVTGNGAYPFTTQDIEWSHVATLVVVYSNPANPATEVRINDGAEWIYYNDASQTAFSGVNPGDGKLLLCFGGARGGGGDKSAEVISFNSVAVGGPIDGTSIPPMADLFELPVTTNSGTNAASVTDQNDFIGWILAILVSPGLEIKCDLTVTVYDAVSTNLLAGATVSVTGPETQSGNTGGDGKISFDSIKTGNYQVIVTASGHLPSGPRTVTVDSDTEIAFRLLPTPTQVVPEVPIGTIAVSASMIIALLSYLAKSRLKNRAR